VAKELHSCQPVNLVLVGLSNEGSNNRLRPLHEVPIDACPANNEPSLVLAPGVGSPRANTKMIPHLRSNSCDRSHIGMAKSWAMKP